MTTLSSTSILLLLSLSAWVSNRKTPAITSVSMLFTTSVIRIPKKYHSDSLRKRREKREKRRTIVTKGMKMGKNRVVKRRKKKKRKMMKWVKMKVGKSRRKRGDMLRSIIL
jgi:hypothetical protein